MPAPISTLLFRKWVAEHAGVESSIVHKVLEAELEVLEILLEEGGQVRMGKLGLFEKIETKPTRRRLPGSDAVIDVPAKTKIVFKQSKSIIGDSPSNKS